MTQAKVAVHYSSARHDWRTPRGIFDDLHREFRFTLDAAASDDNALLPTYFTEDDNGLWQDWSPGPAFCNPPYSHVSEWVKKAAMEQQRGVTSVLLIPSRTDTAWFHDWVLPHAEEIRFLRGRINFEADGPRIGHNAPFPSMIVVFRAAMELAA